jgi:hypothetical protein
MKRGWTTGWVLYRRKGNEDEFFGIYRSQAAADDDLDVILGLPDAAGWKVKPVNFMGWGEVVFDWNHSETKISAQ